jgi:hypothetical protein
MRIGVKVAWNLRLCAVILSEGVLHHCLRGVSIQCSVYYQKSLSNPLGSPQTFFIPRLTLASGVYFGFTEAGSQAKVATAPVCKHHTESFSNQYYFEVRFHGATNRFSGY